MPKQNPVTRVFDLERATLCVLCVQASVNARNTSVMRELSSYIWQDAEHRVVFEAIQRLCSSDPQLLREQLPAQTTRMGFPDVSWENYFAPPSEAPTDFEALVRELLVPLNGKK